MDGAKSLYYRYGSYLSQFLLNFFYMNELTVKHYGKIEKFISAHFFNYISSVYFHP